MFLSWHGWFKTQAASRNPSRAQARCALRLSFSVAGWTLHRARINTLWPVFFFSFSKAGGLHFEGTGCAARDYTQQLVSGKEALLFFRVARCTISLLLIRGVGGHIWLLLFKFFFVSFPGACVLRGVGGEDASCWHKFGMWHVICDGSRVWVNNWCL